MKQLLLFFSLLLCSFIYGQPDSTNNFSTGKFPEQWDMNKDLRGLTNQVLAWVHMVDDRPFEIKSCILVHVSTDSLGRRSYIISQMHSNLTPFTKWNYSSIHYGPRKGEMLGFHDLHLVTFDHRPNVMEIYELLNRWDFKLEEKGWRTIESGLDEELWISVFGFKPDRKFGLK